MPDERPAPLVDARVDLRDFKFYPVDALRLRDSELAAAPDAEVFRAAVLSWCVAWHQLPAGSLPADDGTLARLLGYGRDVAGWKRIREAGGLRHWVECSDGRLYHPVVAEKAAEAWDGKLAQRWRAEVARVKKHNQRHKLEGDRAIVVSDFIEWKSLGCPQGQPLHVPATAPRCPQGQPASVPGDMLPLSPECPPGNTIQETEKGQRRDRDSEEKGDLDREEVGGSGGDPPAPPAESAHAPTPPPAPFAGEHDLERLNGRAVVELASGWELPTAWGVDAEALGWKPAAVLREAERFRQFWTVGKGAGTRRSVKGWRQSWSNWLAKAEGMRR